MATTAGPEAWATLGEMIAARRKQIGMDQRELAEAAGVSENTVSNYERGRVPASGKVPAGYYKVERALHWARGSVDHILQGHSPVLEVESDDAQSTLRLRSPDDPALKDNPLLREVVVKIQEALSVSGHAMELADLALRWNAPRHMIERYKDSLDELVASMFTPGHGPREVQKYHDAMNAGLVPRASQSASEHPELGWAAAAVQPAEPTPDELEIGAALLRGRTDAGLTVDDLSLKTKMPVEIIQMIERGDFTFWGAALHAPTYIRIMASAVGLDPEPLVEKFEGGLDERFPDSGGHDR